MSGFKWENDKYGLANPELDRHHQDFVLLVDACIQANQEDFVELFSTLLEHTKSHFEEEDRLMDNYDFPDKNDHKKEHQRVLTEMRRLLDSLNENNIENAQTYIKDKMPEWFALHTLTMDNELVAHIMRKKL